MKELLDTNVLIDAIAAREPFKDAAQEITMMAANEQIERFITANSIVDIYYVASKNPFRRRDLGSIT